MQFTLRSAFVVNPIKAYLISVAAFSLTSYKIFYMASSNVKLKLPLELALNTKKHEELRLSLEHLEEEIDSNRMVHFVIHPVQLILCARAKIHLNLESKMSIYLEGLSESRFINNSTVSGINKKCALKQRLKLKGI